jgi:hypothetical protein
MFIVVTNIKIKKWKLNKTNESKAERIIVFSAKDITVDTTTHHLIILFSNELSLHLNQYIYDYWSIKLFADILCDSPTTNKFQIVVFDRHWNGCAIWLSPLLVGVNTTSINSFYNSLFW